MLFPFRSVIKWILRRLVHSLPTPLFRKVIHASSPQLLNIFNSLEFRDKYPLEDSPPHKLWDISAGPEGHMIIQGCDCVSLAKQYGTPLYVVNKEKLKRNYFAFYESFREWYPRIEIGYSYKTNPLPGVIKVLHEFGASAEVVSPYELRLALKLGVSPEKIIYNGPGKTEDGLKVAVSNKIKLINIDGFAEMETIDRMAGQHGHKQHVGIRVITSVGWKAKFGFTIEGGAAFRAFQHLNELRNVIPCGLHFHLGTGVIKINTYLQAIKDALDLSMLIKTKLDIKLKYLDFGGGFDNISTVRTYSGIEKKLFEKNFPTQEAKVQACPQLGEYGREITDLFAKYYPPDLDDSPVLIFEPGRAITSSAQFLLLKVLDIKPTRNGMADVILDGGMNVAAPLGWECHEIFNASKINAPANGYYSLYGPLCTPYDGICQVKRLPQIEEGDILSIMDAGAYFISMQSSFCSFPRPSAILLENGHHELIRKRESFEQLTAQDFPPKVDSSRNQPRYIRSIEPVLKRSELKGLTSLKWKRK